MSQTQCINVLLYKCEVVHKMYYCIKCSEMGPMVLCCSARKNSTGSFILLGCYNKTHVFRGLVSIWKDKKNHLSSFEKAKLKWTGEKLK